MPFDIQQALGADLKHVEFSWTRDDVILYHLGIGAGVRWQDERELEYTYEKQLKVLPTFAVIPVLAAAGIALSAPGIEVSPLAIVHGEHEILQHRALPVEATVISQPRISGIYDRGTGAVIEIEVVTSRADSDKKLFTNIWSLFVRGEGGFGGEAGPKNEVRVPDTKPDMTVEIPILPQQAQIYRLSGDKNPYHVDPKAAEKAGFKSPILHGLCSFGMLCKAVVDHMLDGDVSKVSRFRGRFAKPVLPGTAITASFWQQGDRVIIASETLGTGTSVLTNAWLEVK